jgi:hypothetical protein
MCNQTKCYGVWRDYLLALQYKDTIAVDWLVTHCNIDSIKIYYLAPDGCIVYYFNEMAKLVEPENKIRYRGFDILKINQNYFLMLNLFGAAYHKHDNIEVMWGVDSDSRSPRTIFIQFDENDTYTVNADILYL